MRFLPPLVLLVAAHAAAAAEVPHVIAVPGGFVEPTGRVGVFNSADGGIQVVEMAAGKSYFQTQQAQRPLFLVGDRLYALAAVKAPLSRGFCFEWQPPWEGPRNGFRLVAFDLVHFGEIALRSETVELPEWASIIDAHDRSFALRWQIENGKLVVAWDAKTWYAGPTQKTPQEEAAFRKNAAGGVRFDLQTAAFETLPAQPAQAALPAFETWPELERLSIRWQKRTVKQLLVVTLEEKREKQTLTLRTFDLTTRQPLTVQALKSGERLVVLPTIDEQYLCVRAGTLSPDQEKDSDGSNLRWSLVHAETGQLVGEVPYEPGMTAATIVGSRAYFLIARRIDGPLDRPFVQPRSLRAIDLKTGTTQWDLPVGGKPSAPPPLMAWPATGHRQ